MVFSSFTFLFLFFPLLLIVYFFPLFRKRSIRNGILLVFSLIFYSFGGWRLMPIILLSIAMNYVFGRLADAEHAQRVRKAAVVASVVCNLLLLFVFKYLGFTTEMLHQLFPGIPVAALVLPIWVSFYSFQSLSFPLFGFRGVGHSEENILLL